MWVFLCWIYWAPLPFCHIELRAQKPPQPPYPRALVTIGDHLRKRRLDLGLTQKATAVVLGIKAKSIVDWEMQGMSPSLQNMPKVIDFLGYVPFNNAELDLARKLYVYRLLRGLSQRDLAEELDASETTVREWEKNRRKPNKKHMKAMNTFVEPIISKTVDYHTIVMNTGT